jgi:3-oxoacyl-[acyl-carrier protein] reductase
MGNQIDLSGRVAAVTGGAQGIGRAIVERLLASRAAVAVWDRDLELASQTCAELSGRGPIMPVGCDIRVLSAVEGARDATLEAFGRLDVLVNNAGIAGPNMTTWEYPIDAWTDVLQVNLTGTFHCCRAVVPIMIAQNYGRIAEALAAVSLEGKPHGGAYADSKRGGIDLSNSGGKELPLYDIALNCVAPAAARTALFSQMTQQHIDFMLAKIPKGRFVNVEEIAALVAFCSSTECSFTTGSVFDISGGRATY